MRNKNVQISLFDIYNDVLDSMENNKSELITLIDECIDFEVIIPYNFKSAYYNYYGRKHINSLESFIKALFIKNILGVKEDKLFLTILKFSKELYEFCGFNKLPDASQLSRFKTKFCDNIAQLFENLVDITAPICKEIDSKKSQYLIFDTTGIEPAVKENNPKFFNSKLNTAKKFKKSNENFDPYKGVYKLMPDEADKALNAKHQYINGHFCYAFKTAVVTDGLGIVRNISFLDDDFKEKYPNIISKKSDDPEKDKELADSKLLKPVLSDFFNAHANLSFSTFLADSAFDSYDNYSTLKNDFNFSRVCVPINPRNSKSSDSVFNEFGNPVCPLDGTQFICLGKSGGKNRSLRYKWVCHKSKAKGNTRICTCKTPCTKSSYGKCTYTYPDKDFRKCPGIPRNTEHWDNLYKHRILVERTINIFKDSFGLASLRTQNSKTIKAELFLAGCTQLVGVILAKAIKNLKLYKSLRKIVALAA